MRDKINRRFIALASLVIVSLIIYSSRDVVRAVDSKLEQNIDRNTKYKLEKWQYRAFSLFNQPDIIEETSLDRDLISINIENDEENKYGYIDKTGEIAIPPLFDRVENFKESYAAVKFAGKWGIIDTKGEIVTPFIFDSIVPNSLNSKEGYFKAVRHGKQGLVNLNGNTIIPFKLDRIDFFDLKKNYVKGKIDGKVGITDVRGNVLIPFKFDRLDYHHSHRNLRRDYFVAEVNGKEGIVDLNGNPILPFKFDRIEQYALNIILARKYGITGKPDVIGKIDRHNKFVPFISQDDSYFASGILVVSYPDHYSDRTCIINKDGKLLVSATSSRAGKAEKINNLCRSLAGIEVNNYAVEESTKLIQGDNPFDYYFKEGLLAISINNQYGYVNLKGELAIPQLYDRASYFSSGLAMVRQGDRLGFIDRSGEMVIEAKDYLPFAGYSSFDKYNSQRDCNESYSPKSSHFENNIAIVSKINNSAAINSLNCINHNQIKYYFLNKQNQIISGDLIYSTFVEATPIDTDLIEVKIDDDLRAVMKTNGEIVTKPYF